MLHVINERIRDHLMTYRRILVVRNIHSVHIPEKTRKTIS